MKKLYISFGLLLFSFVNAQEPALTSLNEVTAFFDAHTDPIYIESTTDRAVILEYGSLSYDERKETSIPKNPMWNHTDPNIRYLMLTIDSADYWIEQNTGLFSWFFRSDIEERVLDWAKASYQDRKKIDFTEMDTSIVSDKFKQLIVKTQRKDEIITYNSTGVKAVQEAIAQNKATFHIQLFPIFRGDGIYPTTTGEDAKQLFLRNTQGFNIEIYAFENPQNSYLLAQGVQDVEINLNCLELFNCRENQLRYRQNEEFEWQVYSLMELAQSENMTSVSIRIIPKDNGEQVPTQVIWGEEARRVDRYYRGLFRIKIDQPIKQGPFHTHVYMNMINEVPIEQYIRSVVASEVQHSLQNPIEAFKAQAVLARSYACHKAILARREGYPWDLDPTTSFQSYQGVALEHGRVDQAVAETLGQILTHNGQPVLTLYHSCINNQTRSYFDDPVIRSRTVPEHISCRGTGHGHGHGMPQIASYHLARSGWGQSNNNPSEGAIVPEDINRPWNYEDILYYFYSDVLLETHDNCLSINQ